MVGRSALPFISLQVKRRSQVLLPGRAASVLAVDHSRLLQQVRIFALCTGRCRAQSCLYRHVEKSEGNRGNNLPEWPLQGLLRVVCCQSSEYCNAKLYILTWSAGGNITDFGSGDWV